MLLYQVSALMTRRWQACEWHTHEAGARCEGSEEAMLDRGRGEDDAAIGLERGGRGMLSLSPLLTIQPTNLF